MNYDLHFVKDGSSILFLQLNVQCKKCSSFYSPISFILWLFSNPTEHVKEHFYFDNYRFLSFCQDWFFWHNHIFFEMLWYTLLLVLKRCVHTLPQNLLICRSRSLSLVMDYRYWCHVFWKDVLFARLFFVFLCLPVYLLYI